MRINRLVAGTALLALAALFAPADVVAREPETPRLVMLYATCSLNRQYLSAYDPSVFYTPNLGRFAREAAVFRAHSTEAGLSGTDYASIFAGVQADRHGVFKHPQKLEPNLYLIFEAFRAAGYETYFWTSHPMATAVLNYAQGVPGSNVFKAPLTSDADGFRAVLARLRREPTFKALVVTAFSVTHGPYLREGAQEMKKRYPERTAQVSEEAIARYHPIYTANFIPLQTRFTETVTKLQLSPEDIKQMAEVLNLAYQGRVHHLDGMFGDVWKAIADHGLDDDSLIAFTADHGETLYDSERRFQWTHAPTLEPEVITVPLLIRSPKRVRPQMIDAVTRSIDVYPTLAGLARVSLPVASSVQGENLAPALEGDGRIPRLRAYSHGTLRQWHFFVPDLIENIWASVRDGNTIYSWRREGSEWRFQARRINPGTNRDVEDPASSSELKTDLWNYRERLIGEFHRRYPKQARSQRDELKGLSREKADALRSLGYIE